MSFNSFVFLLFLVVVLLLYYLLPGRARNPLLLAASYVFYAYYSVPLLLYLLLCTLAAYGIARRMETVPGAAQRKKWLIAGLVLNLGVLGVYKYSNFLLRLLLSIFGIAYSDSVPQLSLVVPLGISFITFSSISYLVDVYRGKYPAEKRLLRFALYLGFFPKLVQGPIAKADDVLPQFDAVAEKRAADWDKLREGFLMVLWGLFMKMVIADRLAVAVNSIYAMPQEYSGAGLVFATCLFALQIYFDFAGYSCTAIGAAKMFGIELKANFRQPYLSHSVSEFWRRWHISLNQWLTDYLYIPLGGSRCSSLRAAGNTLITFGLSGLWHGANWGYVIWGLLNGLYVVIEKQLRRLLPKRHLQEEGEPTALQKLGRAGSTVLTFILVTFAWLFFRAETWDTAWLIVRRIFGHFDLDGFIKWMVYKLSAEDPSYLGLTPRSWIVLGVCLLVAWIVDLRLQKRNLAHEITTGSLCRRWLVWIVLLLAIILCGMYGYGYSAGAFIYAQF